MRGVLRFLGTGSSVGVPMVGCTCPVCLSKDPRNHRFRPAVTVRFGERLFLVDAGPDFRMQALRFGIDYLDGVLLTHAHHDHTAGLDDLRPIFYKRNKPLPILLSAETSRELHVRFAYFFQPTPSEVKFEQRFDLHLLPHEYGSIVFETIPIEYVTYGQCGMSVNGFRFGDLAYITDIRRFEPVLFEQLKGVKKLVVSALRYTPTHMHFSIDEAIDFARQLNAQQVWMTHISHDVDHEQASAYLPANMHLAYDGLEIEVLA